MTLIYSAIYLDDAHLLELNGADGFEGIYTPDQIHTNDSILILHGGADISPSIYGQKPGKHTQADETLSPRDQIEVDLAKSAFERGIPVFGICRGAQLLCALSGGSLIQHVTGHNGGKHPIITKDGERLETTSAHHQMMNLAGTEHELLAWSKDKLSRFYLEEDERPVVIEAEPEIVFFPKIKSLAVQGHPEWMKSNSSFVQYCLKLISEKML